MRDGRTAPVTYRVHLTRPALLVAALGVLALGVGFLAPLSAEAGDHQGGGVDVGAKPWVCHPVEGAGETGSGWNLIDPSKASSHIDEATGAGKHTRKDGSTDVYAVWTDGTWTCPGSVPPTTTTTTSTSPPTTEPPTTEPPTTEPPTTSEPPTATTTAPSTETPGTGATVPSTTSSNPLVPGTTEGETPEEGATVAPTTPSTAAGPEVGAVQENAVPQAHTDGADLVGSSGGWTGLQATLVGAGLLMVASGGLMTVRREPVDR